jgi:hypothetical protein
MTENKEFDDLFITQLLEWKPENITQISNQNKDTYVIHWQYEKGALEICIKLLLHITLISIFETLFYFLYVSSLENSGIEWTVDTFINGAVNGCKSLNSTQIKNLNNILEKYIDASHVINTGNLQQSVRILYNDHISLRAWIYIGGFVSLFSMVFTYIKCRRIKIGWTYIILENTAMVLLLALYELVFFNTIIYPYQPLSSDEIERNAIQQLQNGCGLLRT